MIVCPQHTEYMMRTDCAVFLIPKCGSTTLRETLPQYGFKRYEEYMNFNGHRKVAIIRNPLDRFLSAFITVERLSAPKEHNPTDLLGNFVLTIFRFKEYHQDFHYLPQVQFLKDRDGKTLEGINYLLFDSLKVDWTALGLGIKLPCLNQCFFEKEHRQITDYLNRHWELTGIIDRFYQEDWELFNRLKGERNGN